MRYRGCPPTLYFLRCVWCWWWCVLTDSMRWYKYMYTVYVYCKQSASVQTHHVYMLYNITLRFVCSLSGFCLVGSVDVLGAERCGGNHSVLHGSGLAFGPGVWCRAADRHGTEALHSSLPQTHIVEVSSTWPLDLALWVAEDRNLKGTEKGLTRTFAWFDSL